LIPLDMPGANNRVANLKRAISEYVAEYNVCKCQPCHNGGTVMLVNGRCTCLCLLAFDDGVACQNFKAGEHNAREHLCSKFVLFVFLYSSFFSTLI